MPDGSTGDWSPSFARGGVDGWMDGRDCRVGWRLVSRPFLVKTIRWPSLAYPPICRPYAIANAS